MSKFAKLKSMLESKGLPSSEAGGILYNQGKKKFGKKAMSLSSKNHIPAATAKQELKKK